MPTRTLSGISRKSNEFINPGTRCVHVPTLASAWSEASPGFDGKWQTELIELIDLKRQAIRNLFLTDTAIQIAEKIGPVTADLRNNSCQVTFAPDYIRKVQKRGTVGKKRKTAKCRTIEQREKRLLP